MRSFLRPPPNRLYFGTHDLLQKPSQVSKVSYFFDFILPSRLTAQNIGLYLKGALYNIFFQTIFSYPCLAHVGHHVQENLGELEVVEKSPLFKNWLKLDQMFPPKCGHFIDHLQITSILAHMISCTNKARFPRFCIFLNFFEFILPCRLTAQKTSVSTSRGHCTIYFFQTFLSQPCLALVGHYV